jgi:hypothetical protein
LARLQPATSDQFRNELTACLSLVVPVGMTEEARRDWLAVAWGTLSHLPADVLAIGCEAARKTCDHPSKIVPTILKETADVMRWRREANETHTTVRRPVMDRRGEPMSDEDTAELNGILDRLNACARYRSDGSRYEVERR